MPAAKTPKKKSAKPARRRSNAERFDVYQHINDRIVEALEQGVKAWRKPWTNKVLGSSALAADFPRNAVTGRQYRGINVFLLYVTAATEGYNDPRWLTFNQAAKRAKDVWLKANGQKDNEAGEEAYKQAVKDGYRGGVRKGEKSTLVTLWRPFETTEKDEKTGEEKKVKRLLLKSFSVFNAEQCDNLDLATIVEQPDAEEAEAVFEPIEAAASIVAEMPKAPSIRHGGNRAFYAPAADSITLPEPTQFESPEAYYATTLHELVHSTGHESRLHRVKEWGEFGSEPYAQEELVAELGAAFLCGIAGLDADLDQSAAYIGNWASAIREATATDKRWLVVAAARAQRAADFILGQQTADTEQPKNGEAA